MISIIIPCYNQGRYLKRAVESVLAQTYKHWELIIINDASTDNTAEVIEEVMSANLDKKIRTLYTLDVGPSNARHTGIIASNGTQYVPLDADDTIDPYFLEKTFYKLDDNRRVYEYVYVDTVYVHEKDGRRQNVPSPDYSVHTLINNNFMSYCCLIEKEAYFKCGGYDLSNFGYWEDYLLFTKLARAGYHGAHLRENLFYYNVHEDSSFQSERANKLQELYKAYMITKVPDLYPAEWRVQAKGIVNRFPKDFMSWKPAQQAAYVKKENL